MKKILRFLGMMIFCCVAAFALISLTTNNPDQVAANLAWAFTGTTSFIMAALLNPMRTPEREREREKRHSPR